VRFCASFVNTATCTPPVKVHSPSGMESQVSGCWSSVTDAGTYSCYTKVWGSVSLLPLPVQTAKKLQDLASWKCMSQNVGLYQEISDTADSTDSLCSLFFCFPNIFGHCKNENYMYCMSHTGYLTLECAVSLYCTY